MFDISLSPSNNEFFIKPGQKYILAFNITNNSKTSTTLNSSVESWLPKGIDGQVSYDKVFSDPTITFSLNNADLALGESFIVNPGETRQLVLKIATLPETNRKDHYYTFFLTQKSDSQLGAKIGAHMIVTTQNKQESSLSIRQFSASPFLKDSLAHPIDFSSTIINNSSQFTKIPGKLVITKNDLPVKEFIISPDTILGGYSRRLRCANKNAEIIPCAINPPFWPGFYKATLTINSEKPVIAELNYFVFPYSVFLSFFIITSLILVLSKKIPFKIFPKGKLSNSPSPKDNSPV